MKCGMREIGGGHNACHLSRMAIAIFICNACRLNFCSLLVNYARHAPGEHADCRLRHNRVRSI